ncbi:hypothetical protein LKD70_16235 [Ruminococcus sp. CLA-AA-H200]|uniref:Uncharacterized protein n=1 Tax=Ruminococcus turbiniformis TaxID=2881258 RepID=A0ABS8G111_9FIRM|nr:hypothetical protein [Ruminococcus turbiniformis]MCC2255941.1 hypothetical protein [Ruminococcus turbiniformis]
MPRGRRKVVEKDYSALLEKANDELTKLETEYKECVSSYRLQIKDKKAEIKKLEKDKAAFDAQKAEEEKAAALKEVAELIVESGKSIEEIKELLAH